MSTISRRDAIKKAALLLGGTLAVPDILKAWGDLSVQNPEFVLFAGQDELIAEIAETIVPATKTPGAKAVGVPAFIKKIVADCYDPEERSAFMAGLDAVDAYARTEMKVAGGFVACNATQRTDVLKHFEALHAKDRAANPWWGRMKGLAVTGYFTSEVGCTQVLRYEPVPGRYDGAFPYKKGDRAFA